MTGRRGWAVGVQTVAPASRRCGGGASVITEAARDRATGTGTGTGKPERLSDDLTASGTDTPIKNTTPVYTVHADELALVQARYHY